MFAFCCVDCLIRYQWFSRPYREPSADLFVAAVIGICLLVHRFNTPPRSFHKMPIKPEGLMIDLGSVLLLATSVSCRWTGRNRA